MLDVTRAPGAVLWYEKTCPALRDSKTRPPIDWGQFKKYNGVRVSTLDIEDTVPYERDEWIQEQVNGKMWTRLEAQAEWDKRKDSGKFKADNSGHNGREVMWMPTKPVKRKQREQFQEDAFEQGGVVKKKMKAEDIQAMQAFAVRTSAGHGDSFFKNSFNAKSSKAKYPWKAEEEQASDVDVDSDGESEDQEQLTKVGQESEDVSTAVVDNRMKAFATFCKQARALESALGAAREAAEDALAMDKPEYMPINTDEQMVRLETQFTAEVRLDIVKLVVRDGAQKVEEAAPATAAKSLPTSPNLSESKGQNVDFVRGVRSKRFSESLRISPNLSESKGQNVDFGRGIRSKRFSESLRIVLLLLLLLSLSFLLLLLLLLLSLLLLLLFFVVVVVVFVVDVAVVAVFVVF